MPGAWHAVRADLPERLSALPSRPVTVLASPDGMLAALAAEDLAGRRPGPRRRHRGLDGGRTRNLVPARRTGSRPTFNDVWLRPYDRGTGVEDAMQAYLDWEIDLVAQLARDGTARFGPFRES